MTESIARTAATQTQVLALELGLTDSAKKEIIQKHLVAMLAMERERAWNAGYLAGFMASGEGWNGEYPDDAEIYQRNSHWLWRRLVRWKEYSAPLPADPEGGEQP